MIGTMPPSGVKLSCMALTEPLEAAVVATAQRLELAMPKRTSLPSMLAGIEAERGEVRIAVRLRPSSRRHAGEEDDRHGGVERPALPLVLDHPAEGVGQRGRDQQDEEHLEEVAERRRVLVGDGRVGVEEAAAVGAELLDRDLRGRRALARASAWRLRAWSRRHRRRGSAARPARRGTSARDDRDRQQHVERAARQIDPEVADGLAPRRARRRGSARWRGRCRWRPTRSSASSGPPSGVR